MIESQDEPTPDLDELLIAIARRLRAVTQLLDSRLKDGRLESLTLRIEQPGRNSIDIDVAHVSTFEATTWEPAPRELVSLVGARSHTLHSRDGLVTFRLATWVDSFDDAAIAAAIQRRLAAEQASGAA